MVGIAPTHVLKRKMELMLSKYDGNSTGELAKSTRATKEQTGFIIAYTKKHYAIYT